MMIAMMATVSQNQHNTQIVPTEIRRQLTADTQANPLLLPRRPRTIHRFPHLRIARHKIRMRILNLLLNILHQRLLLHHNRIQVLEQLLQLHHRALDLLDRVVALLHIPHRALRLASAIRVKERLLEDLRVAAIHCRFPDLCFRGFRVDDEVLSTLLLLDFFAEVAFLALVGVDGFAYPAVQRVDLGFVPGFAGGGLGFDSLDSVGEAAVAGHDVGAHGVDFFIRGAVAGCEAALEALEIGEAVLEVVDGAADLATFVEDGVGVLLLHWRGGLGVGGCVEGLHFYVVVLA